MSAMMTESLSLQWKATRWALVPFVLAGFGLPLVAMAHAEAASEGSVFAPGWDAIAAAQQWVPLFPVMAALLGVTIGLAAWAWDHRAGHVYALSLPLPRWRYALLKLGAGAAMLLVPVAAAWAGALLGALTTNVPEGLHAYPNAFGTRFLLASLIAYVTMFAFAAGTMKTAIRVLSAFLVFLIFGSLLVGFVEQAFGYEDLWTPIDVMNAALGRWPGPFHVFGGNWMLIDV